MGLRDAAAAVPAKPIIATVLIVTIAVAAWRGWTVRDFCLARAAQTSSLQAWAKEVIAGFGAEFRLEAATDFDWDEVRISQGVAQPGTGQNCPFGWHWNNDKRAELAKAGDLTLIGFFNLGRFVAVADFDRRWAEFKTDGEPIPRENAVFVNIPGTDALQMATPLPVQ